MKVALFVHCFFPDHIYGTETYTLQVAKHLKGLGHEAVVVTAVFQGEKPLPLLVNTYDYEGIRVYSIDKNKLAHSTVRETYYQESMREVLRGLLRAIRPDIVHVTHLINHTAVLLEVAHEFGLPIVGTLTDFFGFCFTNKLIGVDGRICGGPNWIRSNCLACYLRARQDMIGGSEPGWMRSLLPLRAVAGSLAATSLFPVIFKNRVKIPVQDIQDRPGVLASCYRLYDAVITPSRFLHRAYRRNGLAVPSINSRFGVDIDRTPKPKRPAGQPLRIGYIGQLASFKGVDLLVKAFTGLPRGSAHLRIFGPEEQDPVYTKVLKEMAEGFPITFHGTFPSGQMGEKLRDLDLIVIPSRWYENSPLVLLHSLATHTPVIVSDGEGMTEFLVDGKNGFRFKQGSAEDLRRQLLRFTDDTRLAFRMSETTEYPRTSRMMVEDLIPVYEQARVSARMRMD